MRILVIGGAGFIGSSVCRYILDKYPGYKISVLDDLSTGSLSNLGSCHASPYFQFYVGFMEDYFMTEALIEESDLIINFANKHDTAGSIYTECIGTQILLETLANKHNKRLIHISDYRVYGGYSIYPHTEESPLLPITPLAASKAAADLLVMGYSERYSINSTILRIPMVYGATQAPEDGVAYVIAHTIGDFDLAVQNGTHEFIHIDDLLLVIDRVIHSGKRTNLLNVGSGKRTSMHDVAHIVRKILGKKNEIRVERISKPVQYGITSDKAFTSIGKYKTIDLEEGLEKTINWYVSNEVLWRDRSR